MDNKSKIIVSIPAYNEERTIGKVIREVKEVMNENRYSYKILVLDDGSKDSTAQIAKKEGVIIFSHQTNQGLAETFRTEIQKCLELKADVIVHIDADGQYLPKEIPKLLKKIEEGYDLVLGSRFKGKIEYMPFVKSLGNRAFSRVVSSITRMKISDAQTGFRAFKREVAENVKLTSTHTYTQEQVIRTVRLKFKLIEVPIYFRKRHGKSRLIANPFGYALKAWLNLLRIYRDYEPLKFFGYIGGLFFVIGFVLGIWVVYNLIITGTVGGLPRVMLSVLFISVGVQIWLFGFLADMMKK